MIGYSIIGLIGLILALNLLALLYIIASSLLAFIKGLLKKYLPKKTVEMKPLNEQGHLKVNHETMGGNTTSEIMMN